MFRLIFCVGLLWMVVIANVVATEEEIKRGLRIVNGQDVREGTLVDKVSRM